MGGMNKPWLHAVVPLLGALWLAACTGPTELAPVLLARVVLGAPEGGLVRVEGLPGAVVISEATTLTVTMVREGAQPVAYRLQHLNGGLAIASTFAEVRPDGSFGPVLVGSSERPVQKGDELNLTPQAGVRQVGYTVFGLKVP